jgi:hypothetical protein
MAVERMECVWRQRADFKNVAYANRSLLERPRGANFNLRF